MFLTQEQQVKFESFLEKLQEKCIERDSSAEIKLSFNAVTRDWDVTINHSEGEEIYVVGLDFFREWFWMRRIKL